MFDDMDFLDNNADADTNLADLDTSRLDNIEVDVNTGDIGTGDDDEPGLFAANNLLKKTSANLSRAEAMVNENPLRTEKTAEIERRETEDNE